MDAHDEVRLALRTEQVSVRAQDKDCIAAIIEFHEGRETFIQAPATELEVALADFQQAKIYVGERLMPSLVQLAPSPDAPLEHCPGHGHVRFACLELREQVSAKQVQCPGGSPAVLYFAV